MRELPKDVLKMASGLILPSGLAGHHRQLCIGTIKHCDNHRKISLSALSAGELSSDDITDWDCLSPSPAALTDGLSRDLQRCSLRSREPQFVHRYGDEYKNIRAFRQNTHCTP